MSGLIERFFGPKDDSILVVKTIEVPLSSFLPRLEKENLEAMGLIVIENKVLPSEEKQNDGNYSRELILAKQVPNVFVGDRIYERIFLTLTSKTNPDKGLHSTFLYIDRSFEELTTEEKNASLIYALRNGDIIRGFKLVMDKELSVKLRKDVHQTLSYAMEGVPPLIFGFESMRNTANQNGEDRRKEQPLPINHTGVQS